MQLLAENAKRRKIKAVTTWLCALVVGQDCCGLGANFWDVHVTEYVHTNRRRWCVRGPEGILERPPRIMVNTPYATTAGYRPSRGLNTPCHTVTHDGAERLLVTRVAFQRMAKLRPYRHPMLDFNDESYRGLVATRKTLQMAAKGA